MKRRGFLLAGLISLVAIRQGAGATVTNPEGFPYSTIAQRNIFGLAPRKPKLFKAPPRPTAKITLGGTISLGPPRALLKVVLPAVPPEAPREVSLILAEGQEKAGIRVLEINEKAGSVKVDNLGTVMVITFDAAPEQRIPNSESQISDLVRQAVAPSPSPR